MVNFNSGRHRLIIALSERAGKLYVEVNGGVVGYGDMMPQLQCLVDACEQLGVPYSFIDTNHNVIKVDTLEPVWFVNSSTSLNDEGVAHLCKDKDFAYQLLHKVVPMPPTFSYLDPGIDDRYAEYVRWSSYGEIADQIVQDVGFPAVVKRNAGAQGKGVFACQNQEEVAQAVRQIFDKGSEVYDFVALAQPKLAIVKEWRLVVFDGHIELVYLKDISQATFVGNLSPLHWQNARAVIEHDQALIEELQRFIQPIFGVLNLRFGGLDVIKTIDGSFYVLEANTKPGFGYLLRDNGPEPVVHLYRTLLKSVL